VKYLLILFGLNFYLFLAFYIFKRKILDEILRFCADFRCCALLTLIFFLTLFNSTVFFFAESVDCDFL